MSLWPLPLASSAITASPRPEAAGLTRIGKAHQRSVPALAGARHKKQLGLAGGLARFDPQPGTVRYRQPGQCANEAPVSNHSDLRPWLAGHSYPEALGPM